MKKTIIAGAAAIALAAPAYAEIEGDLSLSYDSQHSFRGMNDLLSQALNGGSDDALTTQLNVSYGLSDQLSFVAGTSLTSISDGQDSTHDSYRGGFLYTTECFTIELGYQHHDFVSLFETEEIYLNVATECPITGGNLNLFIAHDVDELDGTYVELSLNKTVEVLDSVELDVTVGVSYSFDYWENLINTGDDFNHAYITVGMPINATEALTLTPYVSYSQGFDALDSATAGDEDDELTVGLKASVNF